MEDTARAAWETFCKSGKIADYLQYRAALHDHDKS